MGKGKERKKLKKERNEQLRAVLNAVPSAGGDDYESESDDEVADAQQIAPSKSTPQTSAQNDDDDNDEVDVKVVPSAGNADEAQHHRKRPRQSKLSWNELKQRILENFDIQLAERLCGLASEHDGNAIDPLFTVWLKGARGGVPVPHHWCQMAQFLSKQTDRESCAEVVPAEVEATDVQTIRQTKGKGPVNQISFVTCFLTGSPLLRKRFGCYLTRHGEVYRQGQWLPPKAFAVGTLSEKLRQALGISETMPPPWLRSMQALGKLPPAYPSLLMQGLNAPIPPGAQWGQAEDQWGVAVRRENGSLMFPHIMDDPADAAPRPLYWGDVPPLTTGITKATPASARPASDIANKPPAPPEASLTKVPAYAGPPIVAPAFFAGPNQLLPTRPQRPESFYQGEYMRAAADPSAPGLLAAGTKLVPKLPPGKPSAPLPPAAAKMLPSTNPTKF